jgi:hypothetical protein
VPWVAAAKSEEGARGVAFCGRWPEPRAVYRGPEFASRVGTDRGVHSPQRTPDFAQRRAEPRWHRGAKRVTRSGLLSEFPGLGHERGDLVLLDAAREPGQDVAEVCDRVYVAEVACGKDGEGNGGAFAAGMRACEKKVATRYCRTAMQAFDERLSIGSSPSSMKRNRCTNPISREVERAAKLGWWTRVPCHCAALAAYFWAGLVASSVRAYAPRLGGTSTTPTSLAS